MKEKIALVSQIDNAQLLKKHLEDKCHFGPNKKILVLIPVGTIVWDHNTNRHRIEG